MSDVTIVGAGLSGLIAAISLAGRDHKVRILEREERIGGMPEFRPDPAGSPFDLQAVESYTGIDIAPAVKPIDRATVWAWGKPFDVPMRSSTGMYMVERGSRASSIDSLLFERARALGVEIEFGHPVTTQGDFARLPADTIVATGLRLEPYEALGIPYSHLYGYFAKGTVDHEMTTVSLWMDSFTRDYAFNCTVNGVSFALLFQRGIPLSRQGKVKFTSMLSELEGVEYPQWNDLMGGACPVGSLGNPRIFHGNKILAGTFAGVIDPFLFFGMLGGLVSGKIAARAIEDKAEAYRDFRRATVTFYHGYVMKKLWDRLPDFVKAPLVQLALRILPGIEEFSTRRFARNIPGWRVAERGGC